jgi:hypothetical protein
MARSTAAPTPYSPQYDIIADDIIASIGDRDELSPEVEW